MTPRKKLSSLQKGTALAAIEQFSKALAFDDPVSYRRGAKQVAAVERAHLIAALKKKIGEDRTPSAQDISAAEAVDAILAALGRDDAER